MRKGQGYPSGNWYVQGYLGDPTSICFRPRLTRFFPSSLTFIDVHPSSQKLGARYSPIIWPSPPRPCRYPCEYIPPPPPLHRFFIAHRYLSLVVIEMFNAMNALSSSESLLTLPIWNNMKLIYAITLSMVLHFGLLYIPFFQKLFSVLPLNWNEWQAVLLISLPVMYVLISRSLFSNRFTDDARDISGIDELLKYFEREYFLPKPQLYRLKKE